MTSLLKSYLPALGDLTEVLQTGGTISGLSLREDSGIYLFTDINEVSSFQEDLKLRDTDIAPAASGDWITSQVFSWSNNPDKTNDRWFLGVCAVMGNDSADDFAGFTGEPIILSYREYQSGSLIGGMGCPLFKFDTTTAFRTDFGGALFDSYIVLPENIGYTRPIRCANSSGWLDWTWFDGAAGATDTYKFLTLWADAPTGVVPASAR